MPVTMDFMSVSSYGSDTKSSGVVKIIKDLDEPLDGKDVLIVEDIVTPADPQLSYGNSGEEESPESEAVYASG